MVDCAKTGKGRQMRNKRSLFAQSHRKPMRYKEKDLNPLRNLSLFLDLSQEKQRECVLKAQKDSE